MNYLSLAQYMAATVFFTVAVVHLTIWTRRPAINNRFLFVLAAATAGANALAESAIYRADSMDAMRLALRWYVTTSGCWAIAVVFFLATYARVGRSGRYLAIAVAMVYAVALVINMFSPSSFLYTELTGLRELTLPWGERYWLAHGADNPMRLMTELMPLALFGVVANGCYRFWLVGQRVRAVFLGAAVVVFIVCFGTHAYFVDTGLLDSPYLSTYGFLAIVAWMNFELAGEVLLTSELSTKLQRKEIELQAAVATERTRLANDLHDSVTQTLFSTAAIADALPEMWQRRPEEAVRGTEDLKRLTKGALAEMRTLLWELRPASLTEKPLGELLRQLAAAIACRTRMPVDLEIDGDSHLPERVQVAFYRVAQEALHNTVKHAEATRALVQLNCSGQEVALTIHDNGCGLDASDSTVTGMGLEIMRDRVRAIGGKLDIQSTPTTGTTITVHWTNKHSQ